MSRLLWVLVGMGCLTWTGLCWAAVSLVEAGPRAVLAITRWVGLEPGQTQWLGDLLAIAGGLAATVVWIIWAIGVAVALAMAWMVRRFLSLAPPPPGRRGYEAGGPTLDGEVTGRRIDDEER
jgi:hypothetical protein